MNIPFIDLQAQRLRLNGRIEAAVQEAVVGGAWVMGPQVRQFEADLAAFGQAKHALGCANGTDALILPLIAWGIRTGDAVFCPSFTFTATAEVVPWLGATPVFVDVDEYGHLQLGELEQLLDRIRVKAVMAIGLYGNGLPDAELEALCRRTGSMLIEDAAQSLGSRHRGIAGGALGIASALSFAPTKNLPCFGSAGAVACDDDGIAERARALRVHGNSGSAGSTLLGANSQLATSHAAQLLVALDRFEERQRVRAAIAARYFEGLSRLDSVRPVGVRPGCVHNWHKFVIVTPQRDALRHHLSGLGIETQLHYARPLPCEPVLAQHARGREYPNAVGLARSCLTLPLHPHLSEREVTRIIDGVRVFRSSAWVQPIASVDVS